jgi:hypothetical protein
MQLGGSSDAPKVPENDDVAKNRRWNENEHMLYILFLEENR